MKKKKFTLGLSRRRSGQGRLCTFDFESRFRRILILRFPNTLQEQHAASECGKGWRGSACPWCILCLPSVQDRRRMPNACPLAHYTRRAIGYAQHAARCQTSQMKTQLLPP